MIPSINNQQVDFESKVVDKVSFGNFVEYKGNKIFVWNGDQEIGANLRLSGKLVVPKINQTLTW